MVPRIYLMGGCASLPDLGVGWRREAAAAIEAAGGRPVWPPDIRLVHAGVVSADHARAMWTSSEHGTEERLRDLRIMAGCDAALCLFDGSQGAGTAAETAFAAWLNPQLRIAYAGDRTKLGEAAARAVALGKEKTACRT